MVLDLRVGDRVALRRRHPCGSTEWDVVRVGADIGLSCRGCQRRILMDRPTLRRRLKAMIDRGPALDPEIEAALFGPDADSTADGDEPRASDVGNR